MIGSIENSKNRQEKIKNQIKLQAVWLKKSQNDMYKAHYKSHVHYLFIKLVASIIHLK